MFEVVEQGARIEKAEWERRVEALRVELLAAQYAILREASFPLIVLVNGVDGAGKSETVNALTEWIDPRHVRVHALGEPTEEERQRPAAWRFWRRLPPKGKTGIFFGNWYTGPIVDRAMRRSDRHEHARALDAIVRFEAMLAAEGALIVKLWFHLSKKAQKRRLTELSSSKKTAWRVTDEEWERFARYGRFRRVAEETLRATESADAPWSLIEGEDPRHASLTAGTILLAAMRARLEAPKLPAPATPAARTAIARRGEPVPLVRTLDLGLTLSKKHYEKEMDRLHRKLALLVRRDRFRCCSPVVVFEGMDAAGKGGAIRRLTAALDARLYTVTPIAAPSEEERAQPYLWRFWRHVPRDGKLAIFDRSWYGRVLVERVEELCAESDWQRAYDEINDFESQLADAGNVVVKLWLQISPEEQLRRFEERRRVEHKRFKITDEDWRNREKWPLYERAASDMIRRTSTELAPWTMVEAEDKHFARAKVLRTVVEAIERALEERP